LSITPLVYVMRETEGSPFNTDPSGIRQHRADATDSTQCCRVLLHRGGKIRTHREIR
jgi:hypothetical protein